MKIDNDYKQWLIDLKSRIRQSQLKAAVRVNSALLEFYWDLGQMISEKEMIWGGKLVEQVAKDLKTEFPDMQGLSRSNLFNAKKFYQFYCTELVQQPVGLIMQQPVAKLQTSNKQENKLVQQPVALIRQQVGDEFENHPVFQIPWGHHIQIFTKSQSVKEALFYVQKTIENNWSRDMLALQIKSDLYARQGKAISNFTNTLPAPNSELAQQTLKDPYVFDFLHLAEDYKERDIENQLTQHALQDIHKPIGVSEFNLEKMLPDNLKSSLPSVEELEEELRKMEI